MAKKGTKQASQPASTSIQTASAAGPSKGSKVSDQLRQAVKDLGGDEDDLDLIEGIDSDNEDASTPVKQKGNEKSMDEVGDSYICEISVDCRNR